MEQLASTSTIKNTWTLLKVSNLFEKKLDSKANVQYFVKGFQANGFDENTVLGEYLQYIYDHTDDWLHSATKHTSRNIRTLRNFKTPINNILKGEKYPELKDEYNVAMAQNLPKTFTTVINDIVKTHEASVQDSEEQHQEITEDDEDVSNEDMGETEVLRCENNQLKLQVGRLIEEKKRMKHHMMRLIKVVDDKEAFVSFVHDLVGEYM
jgi:hypothetical protein